MIHSDIIEKARDLIQEAFAECDEYTEVASLFHLIVQEAKTQVEVICKRIASEKAEGGESDA